MNVVMSILGLIFFVAGLFAIASIRSDIQIIIVLVCWGFAIVFFAMAGDYPLETSFSDILWRGGRPLARCNRRCTWPAWALTPHRVGYYTWCMDTLDQLIESELAAIAEIEGRLTVCRARLAAFREAASLISNGPKVSKPVVPNVPTPSVTFGSSAISLPWAKTIVDLMASGQTLYDYSTIYETAQRNGFVGTKDSCRDRVRDYLKTGVMIGSPLPGFKITALGIERANATLANEAEAASTATASN